MGGLSSAVLTAHEKPASQPLCGSPVVRYAWGTVNSKASFQDQGLIFTETDTSSCVSGIQPSSRGVIAELPLMSNAKPVFVLFTHLQVIHQSKHARAIFSARII